jgi:hypothetical protein
MIVMGLVMLLLFLNDKVKEETRLQQAMEKAVRGGGISAPTRTDGIGYAPPIETAPETNLPAAALPAPTILAPDGE